MMFPSPAPEFIEEAVLATAFLFSGATHNSRVPPSESHNPYPGI